MSCSIKMTVIPCDRLSSRINHTISFFSPGVLPHVARRVEQFRFKRERPPKLDALLQAIGQRVDLRILERIQAEKLQDFLRALRLQSFLRCAKFPERRTPK